MGTGIIYGPAGAMVAHQTSSLLVQLLISGGCGFEPRVGYTGFLHLRDGLCRAGTEVAGDVSLWVINSRRRYCIMKI